MTQAETIDALPDANPVGDGTANGRTTFRAELRLRLANLRAGQVGSLPALAGLIALTVIFAISSPVFLTVGNLANLLTQAAPTALLALGLTFVLLLGEIDLSAGTGSGVSAALMALALNHGGDVRERIGSGNFAALLIGLSVATIIAASLRLWAAAVPIAAAGVLLATGTASSASTALIIVGGVGLAVGVITGFLVARVGIPSFVVTLALFLTWQGALLQLIGEGNAIPTQQVSFVNDLANTNLSPALSWVLAAITVAGYALPATIGVLARRRRGLDSETPRLLVVKIVALAGGSCAAVALLDQERGLHPDVVSVRGVPIVVPIVLGLAAIWTVVLRRSAFGRHLYAVGGNAEAARRAGIDVPRMRVAAFAISSMMAAFGGVLLTSRIGGVPSDFGGGNTLLYAVGAAVIGGVSLFGGRGKARDAIVGAAVIAIIPNGLGLLSVSSSYNFLITGVVLLAAASVDALTRKRNAARAAR